MKYINLDQLKQSFLNTDTPVITMLKVMEILKEQSTLDIVRCKECKHWWRTTGANYGDCNHFRLDTLADAYCSYGERREP